MKAHIALLPGDGIGPEVCAEAAHALDAVAEGFGHRFEIERGSIGGAAIDAHGDPLPRSTLSLCERADAVLLGAVGGPKWSDPDAPVRPEQGLLKLRAALGVYANLRPARTIVPGGRYNDVDIVLVRENLEGLYIGQERWVEVDGDPHGQAESVAVVTRKGAERVVRYAFEYALTHNRRKVTLVHKANILKNTSGLFLEVGRKVAEEYADRVECNDLIIDNCAMQLVMRPEQFDVIVTTNLFGDILSDEISGLVGGLGLAPGGNIGSDAAIFEAVHGSAPDIAGQGIANPSALILAGAMMCDHVGAPEAGDRIRRAVVATIVADNVRTRDLGGTATTQEFGDAVARRVG